MIFLWISAVSIYFMFICLQAFSLVDLGDLSWLGGVGLLTLLPAISIGVHYIKQENMFPPQTIWSIRGFMGIGMVILFGVIIPMLFGQSGSIFGALLAFGVCFRIEGRFFFMIAFWLLFAVIQMLLLGITTFADTMSIMLYGALVLGVAIEILTPWYEKITLPDTRLVKIPPEAVKEYHRLLSEYTYWIGVLIGFGVVLLPMIRYFGGEVHISYMVLASWASLCFLVSALLQDTHIDLHARIFGKLPDTYTHRWIMIGIILSVLVLHVIPYISSLIGILAVLAAILSYTAYIIMDYFVHYISAYD